MRRLALAFGLVAVLASGGALAQQEPVVKPPTVLTHVDPTYPPSALASRKHATVVLRLTIDTDGHVSNVDVVQSGGDDLDQAAEIAARQWTFNPATRDGKPVRSRIPWPFHFAPPEAPPEIVEQKPAPVDTQLPPPPTPPPALNTPPPKAAATDESDVEDVMIRGHLTTRPIGVPQYDIPMGELVAVPRTNASHALELAPGFLLTNEGGSGHAEQVFLRGFDAHEGQDLEFTVDGVPINDAGNYHGNGYADTHFIIPETIHAIHVLEGPYAPQQGNFAVAGSADYELGLDHRGLQAEYTYGSFNSHRLLMTYGPRDAPLGTFAAAQYSTTDGFGSNRQGQLGSAIAQYELPVGAKGSLRINAVGYYTEYNNAGIVRDDDYRAGRVDFYGTEDPTQTGNTAGRAHVSAIYETKYRDTDIQQQVFGIYRTMRLRENWTGFLLDVQEPTQTPHPQRGDLIDFHYDALTVGMRGLARWHGTLFGLRQEVEGGYFARIDQTNSTQDRDLAGQPTVPIPYKRDVDLTSTLGDVGVYLDGNIHFLPWLSVRGGMRADMFIFDVLNKCPVQSVDTPSETSPQIDVSCFSETPQGKPAESFTRQATAAGAILPRASLILGPIEHFQFTGSAGSGVRTVDPSYVNQANQPPAIVADSRDIGVGYSRTFEPKNVGPISVSVKSSFFNTHVGQDLIFNPTEGRNTLSTGSTRTGWQGAARVAGRHFDVAANATFVKAVFDDTGLLVPYVPDVVLRGDAAVFFDLPWKLDKKPVRVTVGYGVSYVGPRPLPYGATSDTIFISDASVGFTWSLFNVRFWGQNLFDAKYRLGEYNYASDFHSMPAPTLAPQRAFTAGAPQTLYVSLGITFGGRR